MAYGDIIKKISKEILPYDYKPNISASRSDFSFSTLRKPFVVQLEKLILYLSTSLNFFGSYGMKLTAPKSPTRWYQF